MSEVSSPEQDVEATYARTVNSFYGNPLIEEISPVDEDDEAYIMLPAARKLTTTHVCPHRCRAKTLESSFPDSRVSQVCNSTGSLPHVLPEASETYIMHPFAVIAEATLLNPSLPTRRKNFPPSFTRQLPKSEANKKADSDTRPCCQCAVFQNDVQDSYHEGSKKRPQQAWAADLQIGSTHRESLLSNDLDPAMLSRNPQKGEWSTAPSKLQQGIILKTPPKIAALGREREHNLEYISGVEQQLSQIQSAIVSTVSRAFHSNNEDDSPSIRRDASWKAKQLSVPLAIMDSMSLSSSGSMNSLFSDKSARSVISFKRPECKGAAQPLFTGCSVDFEESDDDFSSGNRKPSAYSKRPNWRNQTTVDSWDQLSPMLSNRSLDLNSVDYRVNSLDSTSNTSDGKSWVRSKIEVQQQMSDDSTLTLSPRANSSKQLNLELAESQNRKKFKRF